jgi:hypothetical protein
VQLQKGQRKILLREARGAATQLVLQATEKLLREKMSTDKDRAFVEKTLESLK